MKKKMDIYEIKKRTMESAPYFFSKETLKFFGQRMSSFRVHKVNKYEYYINAPSYLNGKLMGYTERLFDTRTNELKFIKDE
jgi:hypothetical protein